jgi:hypothetical protein
MKGHIVPLIYTYLESFTYTFIMDRHEGPHNALTVSLLRGIYIPIIKNHHEGPHSALIIT